MAGAAALAVVSVRTNVRVFRLCPDEQEALGLARWYPSAAPLRSAPGRFAPNAANVSALTAGHRNSHIFLAKREQLETLPLLFLLFETQVEAP